MRSTAIGSFRGKRLEECSKELQIMGALSTWAQYAMDAHGGKQVEIRFSNHWGDFLGPNSLEYMLTVTDSTGTITLVETFQLKDIQSHSVKLGSEQGCSSLGAVYFGCISPLTQEWRQGQSYAGADYFYLAYEAEGSYSLVHSQPVWLFSQANHSSWPNCIQVLAEECPRIILGNPGIYPSSGSILLRNAESGPQQSFGMHLEPFEVKTFNLATVPDGWYYVSCEVGKPYAHLVRFLNGVVASRHM